VRAALHSADLTVEHPFRATRLTMGPSIIDIDGERHAIGKKMLSKLFAPDRLADYRQRVVAPIVRETWASLPRTGTVDLVDAVARVIPPQAIYGVLGLPREVAVAAYDQMMRPITEFIGDNRTGYAMAQQGHAALVAALEAELAMPPPAGEPTRALDDIVSSSLADGASRSEAIAAVVLLMLAGTETTLCALANLFHAIAQYPASWDAVRRGELSPKVFVDEVLRLEAPVHHTHRFAISDEAVVGEAPLARGAVVELCLHEANRTDERIADPERWLPAEGRGTGATFGFGRHTCIGKGLAITEMLELTTVLVADQFSAEQIVECSPIEGITFRRPRRIVADRGRR
jgi:cytochrome P450